MHIVLRKTATEGKNEVGKRDVMRIRKAESMWIPDRKGG